MSTGYFCARIKSASANEGRVPQHSEKINQNTATQEEGRKRGKRISYLLIMSSYSNTECHTMAL